MIIIECHVYIVVLNVLYDDVYVYTSLQIKILFCSVLSNECSWYTKSILFVCHEWPVYVLGYQIAYGVLSQSF